MESHSDRIRDISQQLQMEMIFFFSPTAQTVPCSRQSGATLRIILFLVVELVE